MKKEDLLNTTIDQFTRQQWVASMIDAITQKSSSLLDVGGYKGLTSKFSQKHKVTICDLFDVDEPNYVRGDGRKLPFNNSEFDFCVSFDTYEHVPREGRDTFVRELLRVAKEGVFIAAPFDNESGSVHQSEVALNEYHKKLYDGKEHPWLKEHIEYKIPKRAEIEELLGKLNCGYVSFASNDLFIWTLFQTIYFSIDLDEDLRGRVDDINRFYNANFKAIDIADDNSAYRRIYFVSNNKINLNIIKGLLESFGKKSSDSLKLEFVSLALSVFGQKYRDVELYKMYLQNEIDRLKSEIKTVNEENVKLATENVRLKLKKQPLHKKILSRIK